MSSLLLLALWASCSPGVAAPPDGVVAHYSFDSVVGQDAPDATREGAGLTLRGFGGGDPTVSSPFGKALQFTTPRAVATGTTSLPGGDFEEMTIECCALARPGLKGYGQLLFVGGSAGMELRTSGDSIEFIAHVKGRGAVVLRAAVPLLREHWHHFLGLREAQARELRLYVDGRCVARAPAPELLTFSDKGPVPLFVGNSPWGDRGFVGCLDEVRVLTRALTDEEVAERANQGDGAIAKQLAPDLEKAGRIPRLRDFLGVLDVGMRLLGQRIPMTEGMNGAALRYRLDVMFRRASELDAKGEALTDAEVAACRADAEALEQDLVLESIRGFPVMANAPSRLSGLGAWGQPDQRQKLRSLFLQEIPGMFADWERDAAALGRCGIPVEANVERSRVELRMRPDGSTNVDRLFEQTVTFYKRVATERFRLAAAAVSAERDVDALTEAAELRRSLGAKLPGFAAKRQEATEAAARLRSAALSRSFGSTALEEPKSQEATAALRALLFSKEGKVPQVRPGASFASTGRFALGGSWHGLLNCEIRGATLYRDAEVLVPFRDRPAQWSVSFEVPNAMLEKQEVREASWVHSQREYTFRPFAGGHSVKQRCLWSIIAPGALVDTDGPEIALADTTLGNPTPPSKLVAIFEGQARLVKAGEAIDPAKLSEGWVLLLWENGAAQFPVLVVFEHRPDALEWRGDGLVVRRAAKVGRCVLALPYGAAPRPANESAHWQKPPGDVVAQCRRIVPLLLSYPLSLDEFYALDGRTIRVWDRASYVNLRDDWNTPHPAYIPFPPAYSLGLEAAVPIRVRQPLIDTGMSTKYGPYRIAAGDTIEYSMPLVRMWDCYPLKPTGEEPLIKELNAHVRQDWPYEGTRFYDTAAFRSAWCMLDADSRQFLRGYKRDVELDPGVAAEEPLRPWGAFHLGYGGVGADQDLVIESTMGKAYWVRGWRGNRHDVRMRGDTPNYQSMTLAGPFTYAKLFGRWDLVEKHWDALQRAYSCVAARQDWAVPGHDCMDTGFIFSGDMLADGWRCHHLMAALARVLGHPDHEAQALNLGARTMMAIGALMHPNTARYMARTTNLPPRQDPRAIWMGGGNDTGLYSGAFVPETWQPLYALSGCVIWDYPMYDGVLTFFPETFRQWAKAYEDFAPQWNTPAYRDTKNPIYIVNLAGAWELLKTKAWFGENPEKVRELYRSLLPPAGEKPEFYEWCHIGNVLPHVIAEGDPVYLAEWDQAVVLRGEYDRPKRTATIELKAPRAGTLSLVARVRPATVSVNGVPLKTPAYTDAASAQELRVPFGRDRQVIVLTFPPFDPAKIRVPNFAAQPRGTIIESALAPPPSEARLATASGDLRIGKTFFVDLSQACNMGFADEQAGDHQGGTHDDGETWAFPKGEVRLRGVPFRILAPEANGGRSCLVLKGAQKPFFPERIAGIPVGRRVQRLLFFHGTCYTGAPDGAVVLTYILHFAGGETRVLDMRRGIHLGEWKSLGPEQLPDLPEGRGAPIFPPGGQVLDGKGVSGYVTEWQCDVREEVPGIQETQKGLAVLESLDVISRGLSVPLVFAVTAELAE